MAVPNRLQHSLELGMPARRLLRGDQLAVDDHLEHAAGGRFQRQLTDLVLELLEEPFRQTDGSG